MPLSERSSDLTPNESSRIIRKVFQRKKPHPKFPDELKDDEEGYVLISWGDLSPSMAYLDAGAMPSSDHIVQRRPRPITKKRSYTISRAIRDTDMSFEEIVKQVVERPRSP